MKRITDDKMYILSQIDELLDDCSCKKENFELDKINKIIISKNIDTIKNCERDCGLITRVTMHLITNEVDYDLLEDYSIRLHIEEK